MNITRRLLPAALGGMTGAIRQVVTGALRPTMNMGLGVNPGVSEAQAAGQYISNAEIKQRAPSMLQKAALEIAKKDPILREQIEKFFETHMTKQGIPSIDHDILRKRSWSEAAKITFQNQRNREKTWENMFKDHSEYNHNPLHNYLNKLMWPNGM